MKKATIVVFMALAALILLVGCETLGIASQQRVTKAVAVLRPAQGSKVGGIVTFYQEGDKVRIVAEVTGLAPGKHGIHIHEFGDCSSSDGMSAGAHFNPFNKPHGDPDGKDRHLGDLGNLEADKNGKASYDRLDGRISLEGPHSIVGRSVVIKERADDYLTQPGGNAGIRIAFGVIGMSGLAGD